MELGIPAAEAREHERAGLTNSRPEGFPERGTGMCRPCGIMVEEDGKRVRNWGASWITWSLAVRESSPDKMKKTHGAAHTGLLVQENTFIFSKHLGKKAANDSIVEAT